MTDIGNKFLAIYDNLAFVNKLSWLLEDDYNSHGIHKATAQEVFKLILQIIPNDFAIEHKDLSTKARLNIDADTIATSNSSMPLNNHNQLTKIVIYGNKQYAQHRIDCQIRIDSHANQKNNYYAGNILRLQQYLMKSTGKIKHIVYWNSSQLKKICPSIHLSSSTNWKNAIFLWTCLSILYFFIFLPARLFFHMWILQRNKTDTAEINRYRNE